MLSFLLTNSTAICACNTTAKKPVCPIVLFAFGYQPLLLYVQCRACRAFIFKSFVRTNQFCSVYRFVWEQSQDLSFAWPWIGAVTHSFIPSSYLPAPRHVLWVWLPWRVWTDISKNRTLHLALRKSTNCNFSSRLSNCKLSGRNW